MEIQHLLKPFIPDMVPAVPDVDVMLKVVGCFLIVCQHFVYNLYWK